MKKLILALSIMLVASISQAQPFLVIDRTLTAPFPTEYQFTLPAGQTWIAATTPALTTGSYGFRIDLASAPVGTTSILIKSCVTDLSWGQLCSAAATFPLVRPSAPPTPSTVKIVVQ